MTTCNDYQRGQAEQASCWFGNRYGGESTGCCAGSILAFPNIEIGTIDVRLEATAADDPLLEGLRSSLRVQSSHVESVLELPPGARLLASSSGDPHCAFAIGRAAWGVQFHPEFDAEITRAYLDERRELIRAEGLDPDALRRQVSDGPDGTAVLRRFAQLLRS